MNTNTFNTKTTASSSSSSSSSSSTNCNINKNTNNNNNNNNSISISSLLNSSSSTTTPTTMTNATPMHPAIPSQSYYHGDKDVQMAAEALGSLLASHSSYSSHNPMAITHSNSHSNLQQQYHHHHQQQQQQQQHPSNSWDPLVLRNALMHGQDVSPHANVHVNRINNPNDFNKHSVNSLDSDSSVHESSSISASTTTSVSPSSNSATSSSSSAQSTSPSSSSSFSTYSHHFMQRVSNIPLVRESISTIGIAYEATKNASSIVKVMFKFLFFLSFK